jgi:SAM-dependent MidA family methyltransferase
MTPLAEILIDRIRTDGPMTFRDFMAAALYHDEHGYYRSSRPRIGREGDFFTSSHVHSAFGELMAVQVREMAAHRRDPDGPFWVVEAGPGEGHLAADLWGALVADAAAGERFRLGLVEPGSAMRHLQRQRLESIAPPAEWWDSLEEGAAGGPRDGCLLANEVLDAMPVHRVVLRDGRLREIFVAERDCEFVEREADPSRAAIAAHFESAGIRLVEGQYAEINLEAAEWIGAAARVIGTGYLIIIDYGYEADELYAPHRMRGTLLSYQRHQASEEFFADVGERDLTAHVDLSAVRRAAAAAGWEFCGANSQMEFLISLGIIERMERLAERTDTGAVRERLGLRQLIQPGGMGEVFRVLIFRRGGVEGALRGLGRPFREEDRSESPRIG